MFSHLSVPKINLFFFSSPLCRPIPIRQFPSLMPVVTSCIQEFRGFPFLLLPDGHLSKILLGSLSWSKLCASSTVFVLYDLKQKFLITIFSLIKLFLILKTGSKGEYLGLRGFRMGSGEGCSTRNDLI